MTCDNCGRDDGCGSYAGLERERLCGVTKRNWAPKKEMPPIIANILDDFKAKNDRGKDPLTKVPREIIRAISRIRAYGFSKYGEQADHWDDVSVGRYRDSTYRHLLDYLDNPQGVDEESGLPHLWHMACNVSFLVELEKRAEEKRDDDKL